MFFAYDPSGNRVGKQVVNDKIHYTWYVRDAQGNVMAVYKNFRSNPFGAPLDTLRLSEHHLYGSSRLGVIERNLNMIKPRAVAVNEDLIGATYLYSAERGKTAYELSNHLGNVLATVSDRRIGVPLAGNSSLIEYYTADVVTASDYYPFGMLMPGRKYSAEGKYRYGFNGKENDNEVKGEGAQQDYGMRIYDPRLGRFLSVDPLTNDYPFYAPYQFASNSPILAIDVDGMESSEISNVTELPSTHKSASGGLVSVASGTTTKNYDAGKSYVVVGTNKQLPVSSDVLRSVTTKDGKTYSASWSDEGQFQGYRDDKQKLAPGSVISELPVMKQGTAPETPVMTYVWTALRIYVPFAYSTINDLYVGGKTLGAGMFSIDRWEITELDGTQTTGDQRFLAGTSTLTSVLSLGAGSTVSTAKGGFNAVKAFKNAISPFNGGKLTNAGRAATKHPQYFGFESTEALMKVHRTPASINQLGSSMLKDALRNGVKTTGAGGRFPNGWVTYTLPNGHAASWGFDGTFIGFRGLK